MHPTRSLPTTQATRNVHAALLGGACPAGLGHGNRRRSPCLPPCRLSCTRQHALPPHTKACRRVSGKPGSSAVAATSGRGMEGGGGEPPQDTLCLHSERRRGCLRGANERCTGLCPTLFGNVELPVQPAAPLPHPPGSVVLGQTGMRSRVYFTLHAVYRRYGRWAKKSRWRRLQGSSTAPSLHASPIAPRWQGHASGARFVWPRFSFASTFMYHRRIIPNNLYFIHRSWAS